MLGRVPALLAAGFDSSVHLEDQLCPLLKLMLKLQCTGSGGTPCGCGVWGLDIFRSMVHRATRGLGAGARLRTFFLQTRSQWHVVNEYVRDPGIWPRFPDMLRMPLTAYQY